MHRHRPGDGQQPPLAVGQVLDVAVEVLVELELRDGPHHLGWERRVDRPDQVEHVRAEILRIGGHAEVLEHRRVLEQLERLERAGHTGPGALDRRRFDRSTSSSRTRPSAGVNPLIASISDVLPAPFGPIRPVTVPGSSR